jgi:hypothetical protein
MNKKINISILPDIGKYVLTIMQQKQYSIPFLAKKLNVAPDTAYKLLRKPNWKVNELKAVGDILGINLFSFYAPNKDAEWQQRISVLENRVKELEKATAALEQEKLLLQTENTLMRQIVGAKQ